MFSVRLGSQTVQKLHSSLPKMGKNADQRLSSLVMSHLTPSTNTGSFNGRNISIAVKTLGVLSIGAFVVNSIAHCDSACHGLNFDLNKIEQLSEDLRMPALLKLIEECESISEFARALEAIKLLPPGEVKESELWKLSNQCSEAKRLSFSLSVIKEMGELKERAFQEFLDKYSENCDSKDLIKGFYDILPLESLQKSLWRFAFKYTSIQKTAELFFEMPKGKEKDEILVSFAKVCATDKHYDLALTAIEKIEDKKLKDDSFLTAAELAFEAKEYITALQITSKVQEKNIREDKLQDFSKKFRSLGEDDYAIQCMKYLENPACGIMKIAKGFYDAGNNVSTLKALKNMPEGWQTEIEGEELLLLYVTRFFQAKDYDLALDLARLAEKPEDIYAILETKFFEAKEYNRMIEMIKERPEGLLKQKTLWDFSYKLFNAGAELDAATCVAEMIPGWQKEKAIAELMHAAFEKKKYLFIINATKLLPETDLQEKAFKEVIDKLLQNKELGYAWLAMLSMSASEEKEKAKDVITEEMSPLTADQCLQKLSNQYFAEGNYDTARKIALARDPSWMRELDLWTLWGSSWLK